jgi:hypothetical protein
MKMLRMTVMRNFKVSNPSGVVFFAKLPIPNRKATRIAAKRFFACGSKSAPAWSFANINTPLAVKATTMMMAKILRGNVFFTLKFFFHLYHFRLSGVTGRRWKKRQNVYHDAKCSAIDNTFFNKNHTNNGRSARISRI